jgi:hypothetical protein
LPALLKKVDTGRPIAAIYDTGHAADGNQPARCPFECIDLLGGERV